MLTGLVPGDDGTHLLINELEGTAVGYLVDDAAAVVLPDR